MEWPENPLSNLSATDQGQTLLKKDKKLRFPLMILGALLVFLLGMGTMYVWQNYLHFRFFKPKEKICTLEAKICPNGAQVFRTGPNCEFTPCPKSGPSPEPEISSWVIYKNEEYGFEFRYPSSFVLNDNLPTTYTKNIKASENLKLIDDEGNMELAIWVNSVGFGPFFADKVLEVDYSPWEGIYVIKEKEENISQYQKSNKTTIMIPQPTILWNHNISMIFSYKEGDSDKEKLFVKILSTFELFVGKGKIREDPEIELIKEALGKRYGESIDQIDFGVDYKTDRHALGTSGSTEVPHVRAWWLAAKTGEGWIIVDDGNGPFSCEAIAPYDFPNDMINECYTQEGKQVVRN